MFLNVTDIAPDADVHVRVVGAVANSTLRLFVGAPGGSSCAQTVPVCVEMSNPRLVGQVRANGSGEASFTVHAPANTAIGTDLVLQAVGRAPDSTWFTSDPFQTAVGFATSPPPPGGNVLVVVLDDVGVDAVGAYDPTIGAATPTIDGLAADGMRFDNAWAMPICAPTRAALMTGRYPRRTGYGTNAVPPDALNELGREQVTLAELVEASPWLDYQTALVGKWHLSTEDSVSGRLGPKYQGFDVFLGTSGNIDPSFWIPGHLVPIDAGYYHWQRIADDGRLSEETTYSTTKIVDDALTVIGGLTEPWLVVVSFHAAHSPWEPAPEALHTRGPLTATSPISELQRAMVESVDTELGRLLGSLPPTTLDATTVVVMGDNGTKQEAIVPPYNPNRGKREVYDGGVRVPFVVKGPGVVAGAVSTSLVSVVDVFPTVAELAGVGVERLPGVVDRQAPLTIDGQSLLPVLADPTTPVHDVLYAERFAPGGAGPYDYDRRAVRDERYKLVYDAIDGREQLFEYVPGAIDEGPDLLACGGTLTAEQEAARLRLRARMEGLVAEMPFDASPYLPDPTGWQIGVRTYDEGCAP